MQGSLDRPPIVVRGSRGRGLWLLLGSAVFVAGGFLIVARGGPSGTGILSIVFFGLCGVVGVALLIAPPRLEIGPSGIVQQVLWRTRRYGWSEVYNFRPVVIGLTNAAVGFDYLAGRQGRGGLGQLNTAIAGAQGTLQPGLELPPARLADLLNEAREHWIAAAEGAPAAAVAPPMPLRASPSPFSLAGLAGMRINRKAYWFAVVGVFAIAIALSFVPGAHRTVGTVTGLLFIRIFAGRLHDLGRTGWWQLGLYVIPLLALVLAYAGQAPLILALGLALVVHMAFIAVLGAIPGQAEANRYGPPPGQPSAIAVSEAFR
ncbi:MAG TPA: DUF805 domain-containing protein [Caulobacteraceae bacterium]|jgi:uncharacterized membrane protein YhaH (DUF805 family)